MTTTEATRISITEARAGDQILLTGEWVTISAVHLFRDNAKVLFSNGSTRTGPAHHFTARRPITELVTIRVNRGTKAVHLSERRTDGRINFPLCGAPGYTVAAQRAFRPVTVTESATCPRCIKSQAAR